MIYPITRKEFYLAKAAEIYSGYLPHPVDITDYLLAIFAGMNIDINPAPVTREQVYIAKASGLYEGNIPYPITRIERYWAKICRMNVEVPIPITREERLLSKIIKLQPHGGWEYLYDANEVIITDVSGDQIEVCKI